MIDGLLKDEDDVRCHLAHDVIARLLGEGFLQEGKVRNHPNAVAAPSEGPDNVGTVAPPRNLPLAEQPVTSPFPRARPNHALHCGKASNEFDQLT